MKQWWLNLSPREQKMVIIGAFFLAFIILYFFIWSPLSNSVDTLQTNVSQDTELLSWMKSILPQINASQIGATNVHPVNPADLFATVQQSLTSSGLKTNTQNIEQQKEGTIKISFNAVSFDNLMDWLIVLQRDYGITPAEVHLDKIAQEGQVKGEVVLQTNAKL